MVGSRQDALRAPRGAFILVCLLLLQALLITIPVEMVGSVAADDDGDEEQEDEDKDEDEDEDEDEDRWDEESHSYQVEVEEDRVEIEIESENASVESKTKIKIDLEKSAFHLSFEEEADNSEVEQELELTFREVFEFEDSDGDGLHDEGESVLRSFVFSEEVNPRISEADEVQWQMPSVHDISLSGVEGEQVDLVASLGEGNTTFGIVMRIMTDPIELAAGRFVPTEVKMDFLIDDWAWGSNTSRLGLEMYVEAESETEVEGSSLVSRHGLNSIDLALGFSWVEEAEIDGSNLSVAHRTEMLSTSAD